MGQLEPILRAQGYDLVREPHGDALPAFLEGVRPDALAIGRHPSLVIEVVGGGGTEEAERLARLRALVEERPGWAFKVVYYRDASPTIAPPSEDEMDSVLESIERVAAIDRRAALLLAWSSLEAAARRGPRPAADRPVASRSLVHELVSSGRVDQERGRVLFGLADLRNAVAHGGFRHEPTRDDLEVVTATISELSRKDATAA